VLRDPCIAPYAARTKTILHLHILSSIRFNIIIMSTPPSNTYVLLAGNFPTIIYVHRWFNVTVRIKLH
jgi:hypothetical protein